MCGLAGIVYSSPRPIDGETIQRLFAPLDPAERFDVEFDGRDGDGDGAGSSRR